MASLPKTATVMYEEWLRMSVSEGHEEVVDGEIQIMPAPKSDHAYIAENLVADFMGQADRKQYRILSGNSGLVIRVADGYFRSAPQLAIEVLSPSGTRRMTDEKLRDCQSIGVEEAWVISPEAATVKVLLLQDGVLRQSRILSAGILKPRHFPGVQIDISGIWPD